MYDRKVTDSCTAGCAISPPVNTFRDTIINRLVEIRDRAGYINAKATEVSGHSNQPSCVDSKLSKEPSCLTEDIILRLDSINSVLFEIEEKLNRVV